MKKRGLKYAALLMALALGLSCLPALAQQNAGEIKILTAVTGGKDEAEMKLFSEALGKAVGATVIMEKPASDYDNVVMQKLGAQEAYDLIYVNAETMQALQEQGALTDLTEMVKNSPVLGDAAVINPKEWEQVTVDGKIWAAFNKKEVHRLVVINKAIAAKAGVDPDAIPPTLEGYYEAFKKMKAVGGEGFYALDNVMKDVWDLQPWFASAGLKAGLVKDKDGKITVPYASEKAIPVWEWFAKLYKEGLLDPNALTDSSKDMRGKFQTGKLGFVVDWAAWVALYNMNAGDKYPAEFEAYALPGTKAEGGDYMLARGEPSIWIIPANAKNPQGALKVLEYFATQEGGQLLSIGIEGHDWKMVDGKVELTDIGKSHGKDHGAPVPVSDKYAHPVPGAPGFERAMEFLPYAAMEMISADVPQYRQTVAKYATQIINGTMSAKDGVAAMQKDLTDLSIIK